MGPCIDANGRCDEIAALGKNIGGKFRRAVLEGEIGELRPWHVETGIPIHAHFFYIEQGALTGTSSFTSI